jgi:MFS family permease
MAWILVREQKAENTNPKVDYLGAALLVSGISSMVLYFNLGGRVSFGEPAILALAAGSLVLMAVFVLKSRNNEHAIVDLSLFKNHIFTWGIITAALHSMSLSIQTLVLPYYLIDGRGFSTTVSGLLISIAPVFLIILTPISGWLSDKFGSRILCPVGMGIACLSLFMLSRLNADSTIFQILLPQALFGIGDAIFISPNNSLIMGAVSREKLGVASALVGTVRTVNMAAGIVIAGAIFTTRQLYHTAEMAGSGLGETVVARLSLIGGFQDTILFGAIVLIFGTVTSFIAPGIRKKLQ